MWSKLLTSEYRSGTMDMSNTNTPTSKNDAERIDDPNQVQSGQNNQQEKSQDTSSAEHMSAPEHRSVLEEHRDMRKGTNHVGIEIENPEINKRASLLSSTDVLQTWNVVWSKLMGPAQRTPGV